MQPSKAKSTRYQPKALYLVAALLFCTSTVVAYSLEYDLPWISQTIALLPSHNYVHWRTRAEAWQECQKTHKPILYFVLHKKDSASMLLEGQALGDPKVAELIDSQFIPVIHWIDHHRQNFYDENCDDCKYFNNTIGLNGGISCCVLAVPYSLHNAKLFDVNSSANLVELRVENMENLDNDQPFYANNYNYYCGMTRFHHSYGGYGQWNGGSSSVCYGYTNKQDFLDFLYDARLWHRLPPTLGRVKWLPLADLNLESKSAKPKLLTLVQDVGASSDSMRLNLFWKNKSVKLINEKFEPYLIEFHRMDPAFNSKYRELRKRYNVKELPAMIVLNPSGTAESRPPVEHGFTNLHNSLDFLNWALKPGHRMQAATENGPQMQETAEPANDIEGGNNQSVRK